MTATALHPFARIVNCLTNTVIASTDNVIDYAISRPLDALATLSLTFGAADAGAATTGGSSFASALLLAASDLGSSPVPLLLEFSLDNGTLFDSRRLVRQPLRSLAASGRTISEAGTDLGDILGSVAVERATYTGVALSDALAGNPATGAPGNSSGSDAGTILNIEGRGMLAIGQPIPYLSGLLVINYASLPALSAWASGARARLVVTAIISPDIANLETNVDSDADTILGAVGSIVNRLGGAAPDQSYGHWVLDCSDTALNLASSTSFSPPPTAPTPGTNGSSTAFVIGNVGTSNHLTFDASASTDVTEASYARVHLDSCTVQSDDSLLYACANMVGGSSTAGFPAGSRITSLAVLNGAPPGQSSSKDQWYDGLPIVGITDSNDSVGGIYSTILDGRIKVLPGSPSLPCHSLAVDTGRSASPTRPATLYMGTPRGVYYSSSTSGRSLYPSALTWRHLAGLDKDVTRLFVQVDPGDSGHNVLLALVSGSKDNDWDGVWRYTTSAGWQQHLRGAKVFDMVSTDYQTIWVIFDDTDSNKVYQYNLTDTGDTLYGEFPLPAGKPYALGRAITVASGEIPAQDSIWAMVTGADTPAYYLWREDPLDWALPWVDANGDGTLKGLDEQQLQVYTVAGNGVTVDSGFGGPTVNVLIGTSLGMLWTPEPLGGALNWKQADLGGLGNYAIRHIAMGEGQVILGRNLNRVFATTDDDLLYSSSSGRWWETIKGRDRTLPLVYLSEAYGSQHSGDLPPNTKRTWGSKNADGTNMTTSPLGLSSGTHVYIPSTSAFAIPQGYYFERYLDAHQEFQCRLVSQSAHLPGQQMSQLPQLQTRTSIESAGAAEAVALVMKRWMRQHSTAKTHITIESSFSTKESALRTLRPTHKVAVIGSVTVRDISSSGALTTTRIIDFAGTEPLYVISHEIKKDGNIAHTTTVLSPELREQPASAEDLMAGLEDSLRNIRLFR